MLQFQFQLFASTLSTRTTDLWKCGEPCCWCLQLEDKLRVRPRRHGQIAGGEQSRAEPAELSSSMECGFESAWELYPVCASHVFLHVQGRIPWKGETGQYFGPRLPCEKVQLQFRVVIWWPFCPLHFWVAARNVFSSVPCWESPGGCRANQASGHWAPWVGSLKVHSTHCAARGIPWGNTRFQTAMRKTRHGCCPAQWIWDTVYDECYKAGQPDLSLLLLARELYLRDAAPAPPISWRVPLTRSNTSTMHSACKAWAGRNEALEAAVQHDKKLENEKFALRLTAWPSEPPFINLGGGFRPQFPTTSHDFSVHQGAEAQQKSISS